MVNNNQIPFEVNKKPFETVYELKNEVPSFEEFMKGYKVDEATENSYYDEMIAKSGITSYGPGEDWINLRIACPTKGCVDKDPKYWVHKRESCRSPTSYMEWSTEARLRCGYCRNPSHISKWLFRCHRHTEPAEYGYTQFTVAVAMAFKSRRGDENFADALVDFLAANPY